MRILLVEDSDTNYCLLRESLEAETGDGFVSDLLWVERLSAGLEAMAAERFDLVLLDLGLPDSWGLDTLRRTLAASGGVPVIVMSGNDDDHLRQDALELGAQDYIVKGTMDGAGIVRNMVNSVFRQRCVRRALGSR